MLNLADLYWNWKASSYRIGLITDKGFKIKRFSIDGFAVKAGNFGEGYICQDGTGTWSAAAEQYVMKYCVRSRKEIESKYGKILGIPEEIQENP